MDFTTAYLITVECLGCFFTFGSYKQGQYFPNIFTRVEPQALLGDLGAQAETTLYNCKVLRLII